jgi:DNA polymerase
MQLELASEIDFAGWRRQARWLASHAIAASDVIWRINGETSLLDDANDLQVSSSAGAPDDEIRVPREFVELARKVILHRSPDRFTALYRVLLRFRVEPQLLQLDVDPDVMRLRVFERQVRHDEHRMHAYVRFRKIEDENGAQFVAWYQPEHHIVEATAAFFARRFAGQRWAILTPDRSVFWDGTQLSFGDGVARADAPADDALEDLWRRYYASTFNPARVNMKVMQGHMPRKFWANLPEAQLIAPLVCAAPTRSGQMIAAEAAAPRRSRATPVRSHASPSADSGAGEEQRKLLDQCRNCPLWKYATQAVPGEGPLSARLMLVGEQPGDQEDLAGRPFVGPAGQLLDRALSAAKIDRSQVYVTNAVKHFKYELRGKRRLHKKPAELEIAACHMWYESEVATVKPDLIVAMGATAVRAVLGRALPILANRGTLLEAPSELPASTRVLVTVHPSYLLRVLPETREAEFQKFVEDLRIAAKHLGRLRG